MTNNWYWAFKNVLLGPFLRVYNRPTIDGGSNIPTIGAAILASNHQSVMDSFYLPLLCPRQITFPAKSEYFTTPGIVGRLQKWFYTSVGQVPLDRSSAKAGEVLLTAARNILDRGANPIGSWVLRPAKVRIRVGAPIYPREFLRERGLGEYEGARALTDHIMATLSELSGQPYVDLYAADVKKSLAAGNGYPPVP